MSDFVPELTTCHYCRSTNTVMGETGRGDDEPESLCRDCGKWFSPLDHPAGCFYGSFAGAYPDVWHVVRGSGCDLPHGDEIVWLAPKEDTDD